MAKLVQNIHDRCLFAMKKGLTSFYSPVQVDEEIFAEVMNLWVKMIPDYAKTQEIALFFKPFEKIEAVTVAGGSASEGTQPVTNCHKYPISMVSSANPPVRVSILTIAEYPDRFSHPNKPPTVDFPIAKFVGNTVYVAPKTNVNVTYIATPIRPVYAYTVSGDDYIYDDTNSVDLEFDPLWHDRIMNRVLANLGINVRDPQMVEYSNRERATEGT